MRFHPSPRSLSRMFPGWSANPPSNAYQSSFFNTSRITKLPSTNTLLKSIPTKRGGTPTTDIEECSHLDIVLYSHPIPRARFLRRIYYDPTSTHNPSLSYVPPWSAEPLRMVSTARYIFRSGYSADPIPTTDLYDPPSTHHPSSSDAPAWSATRNPTVQ